MRSVTIIQVNSGDRKYNLIITSDHGMAGYKRKYEVSKVLKDKANRFYGGNELVVTITDNPLSHKSSKKYTLKVIQNSIL